MSLSQSLLGMPASNLSDFSWAKVGEGSGSLTLLRLLLEAASPGSTTVRW